ncbi:hypothetical protein AB1I68_00680 [Paenibacillus pabuli]|uniref:hypothetical protein n=1 Tax=Paenibacillus pabuli TaxID=1472 RepID=UPI003459C3BF
MTAIVGFVRQTLSIIITDNRINYGKHQEFGYDDTRSKLFNLPDMGWACGAGLSVFIDSFKESLVSEPIEDTHKIVEIYKKAINSAKSFNPELAEFIDDSVVMASWFGASTEKITFRIGFSSKSHYGDHLALLNDNEILVIYPPEYLESKEKVRDLVDRFPLKMDSNDGINIILERMLKIFNEISNNSKFVSTTCEVGMHEFTYEGVIKSKIAGESRELITELENGRITERIEIVDVIR